MNFSTAKFFIATLYKFTQAGKDEVIHRFDSAIRDQSSTCRYLINEDVFELECALDNGHEIHNIVTEILTAYIEEELRSSEEQERDPNVRPIPESCEDENALSTLLCDTTHDAEQRPAIAESRACSSLWKPEGLIAPLTIMDEVQLQELARQIGCSMSATVDDSSIVIEADTPESIELAMARLAIVERSQCLHPAETHFVETEQCADDFCLRCYRLSFAMLNQTLIPEVESLRDSLHTKLTCRWLSYSRLEGKYVLQPQQLTQIEISPEIEELSMMWIRIPLLKIGVDQLQPAAIIEPQDPRMAQAAMMSMAPDKAHQVDQWISDIAPDPSEPLISLFPSPSRKSAMVRKPSTHIDLEGLTISSSATPLSRVHMPPSSVASSRPALSRTPTIPTVLSSSVKGSAQAPVPSTRASVKSQNLIRTYEETPFGQEVWAKNIVVAGGHTGKIIEIPPTDNATCRPAIPPGYPIIDQQQASRFPETLPFATSDERVKQTARSQQLEGCHTSSSRDIKVHRPSMVAAVHPIISKAGNGAEWSLDPSKAMSTGTTRINNSFPSPATNKLRPGRSKVTGPSAARSTYSSVAKSTNTSKNAYAENYDALPASDSLEERCQEWSEVKSRRYHKTMKQQARSKSQRVKNSKAAFIAPSKSSPTVSTTPAQSFTPSANGVQNCVTIDQRAAPYLFSPILEGMPDTIPSIEIGPVHREVFEDLVGLDISEPTTPIRATFPAPGEDTSAIQSALFEVLEQARAFRGGIHVEVQFGRILLENVPKEVRTSSVTKREWESAMSAHHTVTNFTNMLTTSVTDAAYMLSLRDSSGQSFFDTESCDTRVTYVFDCVHADRGQIRVTVDQMEPAAYTIELVSTLIGAVYLHFPKRTWDCRLAVTGITALAGESSVLEPVKSLVDSFYVRVPEGQVTPVGYFKETTKQLHVENLFLKKELRFKCTNHPSLALKMVEVQALVLGRRAGDPTVKGWARDSSAEMVNERRLWYEVSLEPLQPLAAFQENATLDLGEEASWTAEDLLNDNPGLLQGMVEMAQYVVTRINNVGLFNKGPRGGPGDAVYEETISGSWPREEIGFW